MAGSNTRSTVNILGTLHLVAAGFGVLMLLMLGLHWLMFTTITKMDLPRRPDEPDPRKMMEAMQGIFIWFYLLMGGLGLLSTISSLVTGIGFLRRKWYGLCVAGSALSCLWIPLGTALGVWSLIILLSSEGEEEFGLGNLASVDEREFL